MDPHSDLLQFIKAYDPKIQDIALYLRAYIIELVPEANELIWDNYNALAIAYSRSEVLKDAFCHIALYSGHVNLGFNRGAELRSHAVTLEGRGKLIRHIKVKNIDTFPADNIKNIILEADAISLNRNPLLGESSNISRSIVMSVSEKKLRPKQ